MKTVFIFLANGFEEIEAIAPIDILRRAQIPVTTVSISGNKEVIGAHNITIVADELFENLDFTENSFLILPGGLNGMLNLSEYEPLNELLLSQSKLKKNIAAICAAPSILGKLGLLDGREAVCYPGFEKNLLQANISQLSVVKDEHILTGKGPGVAIDFALQIVEILKGEDMKNEIANGMIYNKI